MKQVSGFVNCDVDQNNINKINQTDLYDWKLIGTLYSHEG